VTLWVKYKVLVMAMLLGCPAFAQTSSYGELQSAYLFNFAKYIKWPEESKVFTVGVLGKDGVMKSLGTTLHGKKIGGVDIELIEIPSLEKLPECQIIYVPETHSRNLSSLTTALGGKSTLIVTEDDLIKKGSMISFVMEDDHLRFKVNKKLLAEVGLVASEGLLKLASNYEN
jgi:hypothetical protein